MLTGAAALLSASAHGEPPAAPTLDCTLGYAGLHSAMHALPGAAAGKRGDFDVVTLSLPETWIIEVAFTAPGTPAHPAVLMRTQRKQVTGVWTSQSKGCGYGDPAQFETAMAEMKAGDTALTNASREAVEQKKQEQSPLGAPTSSSSSRSLASGPVFDPAPARRAPPSTSPFAAAEWVLDSGKRTRYWGPSSYRERPCFAHP